MLIDTDIIVFYMRGNENSRSLINAQSNFNISVVTYMELVQGMRNKDELRILRKAMRQWQTNTIYIDHEISSKAAFYFEQHFLSHSLELADALIAAFDQFLVTLIECRWGACAALSAVVSVTLRWLAAQFPDTDRCLK